MDLDSTETTACLPPWSTFTLTGRGKVVLLPLTLLPLVEDHIEVVEPSPLHRNTFRHARRLDSNLEDSDSDPDDEITQTDSDGSTHSMDCDEDFSEVPAAEGPCDSDNEEDPQDNDYMPSPEWISGFVDHWASYLLRSREPLHPWALADLSPVPKILTSGHMQALGFYPIKWDETIKLPLHFSDTPARSRRLLLFKTQCYKPLHPRLWNSGRETVDRVVANDSSLRIPFKIASHQPQQPTAFAEVKREHVRGRASGWDVLTSVGNYDATEGQLILWENNSVLPFPPGSTFFLPPGLMTYSFTAVSEPNSQMFVVQSLDADLEHFVANGCQAEPTSTHRLPGYSSAEERKAILLERAEVLLSKYPTIEEFDASTYSFRR
ncbi:hypothetical protein C8F04DRAFT_1193575 [Mycena alexandri]|uniref:Uncharacterized protein n=1 Tax=Mycena alexandri TaxID=1745969 RepID=A0AAD6S934_9AGAR|nr:hypothetical protein C8F04DRAFT_1193575 [Mycena alexandri]